jgi:hypothetical protein
LIVDANLRNLLSDRDSIVNGWLSGQRGNPKLVAAGKLLEELAGKDDVRKRLVELERAGRLRRTDGVRLEEEETLLRNSGRCVSNDHHVLALAIVSGARTLATDDDELIRDFKNKAIIAPKGSIYRDTPEHQHLLQHTKSCGIHASSRRSQRLR